MEGAKKILELEAKGCFQFFWNEANTEPNSPGYGLILDTNTDPQRASIASVGFGLSAIIIGVERGWITYDAGYRRTLGTLRTLLNNVEHHKGFYAHFIETETGNRMGQCEFSTIDTAILLNGALTSGEYFGGEIKELSDEIYRRVDWNFIVDEENNWFYMHYWPEIYPEGHSGLGGHWDYYAEQLMMYILAAGSPTSPVGPKLYYSMKKLIGQYNGSIYIRGWHDALFIHQFSHAWFDSAKYIDRDGINWFENSVKATLANRQYLIDNQRALSLSQQFMGIDTMPRSQYSGRYGPSPSGLIEEVNQNDGTVRPAVQRAHSFYPKSLWRLLTTCMKHFLSYGENMASMIHTTLSRTPWFSEQYIGINKGITLLMIENYRSGLIWNLYMKNEHIQRGLEILMFKNVANYWQSSTEYCAAFWLVWQSINARVYKINRKFRRILKLFRN